MTMDAGGDAKRIEQADKEFLWHPFTQTGDWQREEPYAWEEKMGRQAAWAARDEGVIFRPPGNTIVLMPPLAISRENLGRMCFVVAGAIDKVTGL